MNKTIYDLELHEKMEIESRHGLEVQRVCMDNLQDGDYRMRSRDSDEILIGTLHEGNWVGISTMGLSREENIQNHEIIEIPEILALTLKKFNERIFR